MRDVCMAARLELRGMISPVVLRLLVLAVVLLAPMQMTAAAPVGIELPVPKITIYPGDVIRPELLSMKRFRRRQEELPLIRNKQAAIGKVARRTLIAGKPIPTNHLREPQLIQQGKKVRIVFTQGPLTISGVAVALQSGAVGDTLSVRNIDSGTVIKGTIAPDGSVRISGP